LITGSITGEEAEIIYSAKKGEVLSSGEKSDTKEDRELTAARERKGTAI